MNQMIKHFFTAVILLLLASCGEEKKSTDVSTTAVNVEQPFITYDPTVIFQKAVSYRDVGKSEEAFKLFSKAAELGDRDSMFFLGLMYENGESVPANDEKAVEWLTKSADAGNGSAVEALKTLKAKDKKK